MMYVVIARQGLIGDRKLPPHQRSKGMELYWFGSLEAVVANRSKQQWTVHRNEAKPLTEEEAAALVLILGDEDLHIERA